MYLLTQVLVKKPALYLKTCGGKKVLVMQRFYSGEQRKVQLFCFLKKKIINPGVLQLDLNQILFQVLTSAFDLGGKKTQPKSL